MKNQEVVEFVVEIATYQGDFDDLKEATTDILKRIQQRPIQKVEAN